MAKQAVAAERKAQQIAQAQKKIQMLNAINSAVWFKIAGFLGLNAC